LRVKGEPDSRPADLLIGLENDLLVVVYRTVDPLCLIQNIPCFSKFSLGLIEGISDGVAKSGRVLIWVVGRCRLVPKSQNVFVPICIRVDEGLRRI